MGTTNGVIIISYDVDSKHFDIKSEMKKNGYSETWNYPNQQSHTLPNTTLWHSNKSTDGAIADIKSVCSRLNVKLEKAIAVKASEFVGI